jgi:hypothetical protein
MSKLQQPTEIISMAELERLHSDMKDLKVDKKVII